MAASAVAGNTLLGYDARGRFGERATTAASLLERRGHGDLRVLLGGAGDWQRATGRPLARP